MRRKRGGRSKPSPSLNRRHKTPNGGDAGFVDATHPQHRFTSCFTDPVIAHPDEAPYSVIVVPRQNEKTFIDVLEAKVCSIVSVPTNAAHDNRS
jgi:hypothetical protein